MACILSVILHGFSIFFIFAVQRQIGVKEDMNLQMQIAIISASAALLGSLIGAIATILSSWINEKIKSVGKITLHIKSFTRKQLLLTIQILMNNNLRHGHFHATTNVVVILCLFLL